MDVLLSSLLLDTSYPRSSVGDSISPPVLHALMCPTVLPPLMLSLLLDGPKSSSPLELSMSVDGSETSILVSPTLRERTRSVLFRNFSTDVLLCLPFLSSSVTTLRTWSSLVSTVSDGKSWCLSYFMFLSLSTSFLTNFAFFSNDTQVLITSSLDFHSFTTKSPMLSYWRLYGWNNERSHWGPTNRAYCGWNAPLLSFSYVV